MPSRMDRYKERTYNDYPKQNSRAAKNEQLYQNIYADREYSNIEGIASISKNNEIDLEKLKEMLKRKEEREERKYRTAKIIPVQNIEEVTQKEKDYDINEVINKVKKETKVDNTHRSLKSVDLDFLKSLNLQDLRDIKEDDEVKEELASIIHTITNTSVLNQLGDKELSLDMLSELKPTGNTVMDTNGDLKEAIEKEKTGEMDKTFFTTNSLFKKEDFENIEGVKEEEKEHKFIKVIMFILLFVVVILGVYFIINLWKK